MSYALTRAATCPRTVDAASRFLRRLTLCSCVAAMSCGAGNDREPGEIRVDSTPADLGVVTGADAGQDSGAPDTSVDVATLQPDLGEDPSTGQVCGYDDLAPFRGQCDPVRGQGCTAPKQCIGAVAVMGATAVVSAGCFENELAVLGEGEACGADVDENCAVGLMCISFFNECRKLCFPDSAIGCDPEQFCRRPSVTWEGIGFCDVDCNL